MLDIVWQDFLKDLSLVEKRSWQFLSTPKLSHPKLVFQSRLPLAGCFVFNSFSCYLAIYKLCKKKKKFPFGYLWSPCSDILGNKIRKNSEGKA
jgi:hypothetical protein